ncbi:MAG TPA: S24 family peptidase [Nevskia sp.]|nr:S24 family peptidase [Nevskia sp.]
MAEHGGKRAGAGRPRGSGRYRGESTSVVRIPVSLVDATKAQLTEYARVPRIPARRVTPEPGGSGPRSFILKLPAGAPITGDERADEPCDLNALMVHDPESTFLYSVLGDSMDRAGIFDGDRVLVDRSLQPRNGDIVVAVMAGHGHTVKRLRGKNGSLSLEPESNNPAHRSRALQLDEGDVVWGVVTGVVRRVRKPSSQERGTRRMG